MADNTDPAVQDVFEPESTAPNDAKNDQANDDRSSADQVDAQEVPEPVDELTQTKALLAERIDDLQRLQAEYANYKKRVDRDRDVARKSGIETVLRELMPAFDSIGAAEKMGALDAGFKMTAEEFCKVAARYGMGRIGEVGEQFDPVVHEALMQLPVEGEGDPRVHEVMQYGYQINGSTIRPARVVVAMPSGQPANQNDATESDDQQVDAERQPDQENADS